MASRLCLLALFVLALVTSSAHAQSRRPRLSSRPTGSPTLRRGSTPPRDPDAIAASEPQDEPSPLYGAIDLSIGESRLRFVTAQEISNLCGPDFPCKLPGFEYTTLNAMAAIGYRSFSTEVGASIGVSPRDLPSYFVVRAGVRLESGWRSIFSFVFRFGWLYRLGDFEGMGASASVALVARLAQSLAIYGEAACDMTSVPAWASPLGGVLSYTPFFMGGLRFQFGH